MIDCVQVDNPVNNMNKTHQRTGLELRNRYRNLNRVSPAPFRYSKYVLNAHNHYVRPSEKADGFTFAGLRAFMRRWPTFARVRFNPVCQVAFIVSASSSRNRVRSNVENPQIRQAYSPSHIKATAQKETAVRSRGVDYAIGGMYGTS